MHLVVSVPVHVAGFVIQALLGDPLSIVQVESKSLQCLSVVTAVPDDIPSTFV